MNILIKLWTKSSILFKLVLFLFILYILNEIYKASSNKKEGFNNKILNSSYKIYSGDEVYNKFYAGVYDNIMHNNDRMKLETKTILKYPITYGKLLDIGSGTGHLVNLLKTNIDCLGVDNSKHMVLRSKFNYPKNKYIHTDVSDSMIFLPNQFTHITCLYYTIYYIKNKEEFFYNCNKWLVPKGYLFIHLVNKNKFMNENNKSRQIKNYKYDLNFEDSPDSQECNFEEVFNDKLTGNVIKNKHNLYMNSQKEILTIAKKAKFDLVEIVDMSKCDFKFHYLYVLQKNN